MSKQERDRKAVYDWMVNEGTPSNIASMMIYMLTYAAIKTIVRDENLKP